MTSAAKLEANRRKAQRSTGPRSAAGKARVSRNAYKHGLSLPICANESAANVAEHVEALANEFREGGDTELVSQAVQGQIELLRVRRIKADVLNGMARQLSKESLPIEECVAEAFVHNADLLKAFDRYEERALSRRSVALRKLSARAAREASAQGHPHGAAPEPKASQSG
jgi:hypothetical protein